MLEKIGKYEVRLQVGRGAMGVVYEGFDPAIGRRVAIKTLRTEMFEPHQLPEVLARFVRSGIRSWNSSDYRGNLSYGFRLARTLE